MVSILVKWYRKPDPVKPRPPAARRFYFTELARPLDVYIFVLWGSHVLANVANAATSQATVEIHRAALSSLPRPLRLPPLGCHRFHLDRNVPNED